MIQGARALVYERDIDPSPWHICCNGGDMHTQRVPALCGVVIRFVGDNVYIDGDAIERKQDLVCPTCLDIARQRPLLVEDEHGGEGDTLR